MGVGRWMALACLCLLAVGCGSGDASPQPLVLRTGAASPTATPGPVSTFTINALRGTLRLQGQWVTNDKVVPAFAPLTTQMAMGQPVTTEVSISKPDATLGIVSFASPNAGMILQRFYKAGQDVSTDKDGNKVTVSPSRTLTIAGFTAVTQDYAVRKPSGELMSQGSFYTVNVGDRVVVIRSWAQMPGGGPDLPRIEEALLNIR